MGSPASQDSTITESQAHLGELQGEKKPEAVPWPPQTGSQRPTALNKKAGSSLAIKS